MNSRFEEYLRNVTINRALIFIFLVIYLGFYYQQYLTLISLSYLLLGCAFVYNIVKNRKIIHFQFVVICLLYLLYSYCSSLWAYNFSLSYNATLQLMKSALVSICFVNLINSRKDFEWALFSLSLSGVVYGLLFIQNFDISSLNANRIMVEDNNDLLPNINTVGLILSFSFAYFTFIFFYKKNNWSLLLVVLVFVVTFLLGSRKSILSLFICVVLMYFKLNRLSRIKIGVLLIVSCWLLFLYIPIEYLSFVSERLAKLNFLSQQINNLDSSDEFRVQLLESGINYSLDSPIVGNGYYSFSQLFKNEHGISMYSHNNFIETFVGGGVIGFIIYYSLYYIIINKCRRKRLQFDYLYLIIIFSVILLFNHLSIVVLQDRFTWILLALLYAGVKYCQNDQCYGNRIFSR